MYKIPHPTSRILNFTAILDPDPQTGEISKRFKKELGLSDYKQNKRPSAEKN
jgi:hypothetical protein